MEENAKRELISEDLVPQTEGRLSTTMIRESKTDMLRNWEVAIQGLNGGTCTVRVGCKTFGFSSIDEGLAEVQAYFKDPVATREKWDNIEKEFNKQ